MSLYLHIFEKSMPINENKSGFFFEEFRMLVLFCKTLINHCIQLLYPFCLNNYTEQMDVLCLVKNQIDKASKYLSKKNFFLPIS